ncbi:hypothetical protein HZB78_03655 [Candidatus Collierbacteria bacterium]|nr:hypothetical protein [Candidatus Collierbacteria bacterium]
MELKELEQSQQINLYEIPLAKERFARIAPQTELSNFILGAAYCGNGLYALINGLDDSRNRLTQEQKGRIILDSLQQLITLTKKTKNDLTVVSQERLGLLRAATSLIEMCTDSQQTQFSKLPSFEIPIEVRQAVDQWGRETWNEEWTKARDINGYSWIMEQGFSMMANRDYIGSDFIGHCLCVILRKEASFPADLQKSWDDISFLRAFWQQHRPPTTLERLFNRVPKSPYVSNEPGLPTFTTQTYK